MADTHNVTYESDDHLSTTTDGYHDTSTHAYQMNTDQSTDDDWLNTTTDIYQSYWDAITDADSTDDQMTADGYSTLFLTLLVFNWTLGPFILTGNSLTIVVVAKNIKKVTPTHVSIAFLAVAGISVGIVDLLNLAMHLNGNSEHSGYLYHLITWVSLVATYLNISAIFLIAFERCCLVTSLEWHQKHLTVKRQVALCLVFSVYFLVSATIIISMMDVEFRYGVLVRRFEEKSIVHILITLPYALISCSVVYCYLRIGQYVWKKRKALISGQNSSNRNDYQKEKKTTRLIAIILTVYLFGTLPPLVFVSTITNNPQLMKPELREFFLLILFVTSLVDIFIYVLMVPEFKEGYQQVLCCCFRKCRRTRFVPWHNVQPVGMNFPLEPRRPFVSSEPEMNSSAPAKQPGAKDTQARKGNGVLLRSPRED